MRKIVGIAALMMAGFIMVSVPLARAQGFRSGQTASVRSDETVTSTLWTAGNTVDIAGTVDGDVFCAGQNVTISGTVRGDVICAGQTLTISGTVEGDVRSAAQTIMITGSVGGSATTAAQSVTLSGSGSVGKDLSIASSELSVGGKVGRDLFLGGERATVAGNVSRNIHADIERLRLEGSAVVDGKVNYTSRNDASVDQAAKIQGGLSHSIPANPQRKTGARQANTALLIIMAMSLLVTALALVLLVPQYVDSAALHAIREPLKTFLAGALFLVIMPIVVFGLLVSVVGIPLSFLAMAVWFVVIMLSGPMFAYMLGKLIWRSQDNAVLIMLVGSLVMIIAYFLPVIRGIAILAALVFGSGIVILSLKRRLSRPAYRVAPQKAD